eukprot:g7855.t1 g7855   contig26:419088-419760(+)
MTSIKRSNAATLYPSSLYDDDIEAALKTNLLTENEKDISCAGAEYDSDDDEEDNKHISLAMKINNCYSFAIRLLWVLTTWVLLIQNMWVNQTFWIRPNCTFILLLVFSHVSLLSVWGQVCMNKKHYNKHILLFLCLEVAVCTFLVADIFCKIRRKDKSS